MTMEYTKNEVLEFVKEEDISFIFLEFVDILGSSRTVTIMPSEMERAIEYGIAFDGSAIEGFYGDNIHSDLFLKPSLNTLTLLPWRPDQGKAIKFFCFVVDKDGKAVSTDSRRILLDAINKAKEKKLSFSFGSEYEFYLFPLKEDGTRSSFPIDRAGYMSPTPYDKGDQIRREICLMLEDLAITPEASHHEEGPGQNEIDFTYSDAMRSADNSRSFCLAVQTVAERNGLWAEFSPKPLENEPGNGLHINISVKGEGDNLLSYLIGGILKYVKEMTLFFNPTEESYKRLGRCKAPKYISFSYGNRSQLIRIPAAKGKYVRAELRSPDSTANVYIAYALLIYAAIEGIEEKIEAKENVDYNLLSSTTNLDRSLLLPLSLEEAKEEARKSEFLKRVLPRDVLDYYLN